MWWRLIFGFLCLLFVIWYIWQTTRTLKRIEKRIDVQRAKNNQAIKEWLELKKHIVAPGNAMYHEADVIRLIKILDHKLEID